MNSIFRTSAWLALLLALFASDSWAQQKARIPHAQDKLPGPALSPQEAVARMTVPEGFSVEVVASEPDLVNPTAMTIDDRGRYWVCESLEYPRRDPGPGRDRVKILEDTNGDGKVDKVTVFADGLNIPCAIAVGHGGVWISNSPDILFLQDTDGDDVADKREVVVTGFGRADTHELPNSFTWGPDGWLYGLNGVFNPSKVVQAGKTFEFTCALFRIHPQTRKFELFCEGTSNPWGVTFDPLGSAFISACVIDHLWHLAETGYYHRQGGPYPQFTWKLGSIVNYKHQKAAYCGIHYFDSDVYPESYRDKLYMGNIHGGCINVDQLSRRGATYVGATDEDFLTANDAWFMPVSQKTGPDGSLYVLDWYDRYHCYQDANADPAGIEREKGRLYRVRYKDAPHAKPFNLAEDGDSELIDRLGSGNIYYRSAAQRLLQERAAPETRTQLESLVLDERTPLKKRMHALFSLVGGGPLSTDFHRQLLTHQDASLRAWGVRAAGNMGKVEASLSQLVRKCADDPSPDVRLQVAVASRKINGLEAVPLLFQVLGRSADDPIIPQIVWQNLHPLLENDAAEAVRQLANLDLSQGSLRTEFMPRLVERLLARRQEDSAPLAAVMTFLLDAKEPDVAALQKALGAVVQKVQTRELSGASLESLQTLLGDRLAKLGESRSPLAYEAALLLTAWKDPRGLPLARKILLTAENPEQQRLGALEALVAAEDTEVVPAAAKLLAESNRPVAFRGQVLAALGRATSPLIAPTVLAAYPKMEPELQPKAVEVLTQRPIWAKALLEAVGEKVVPASAINVNQVQAMLASKDAELIELVTKRWGSVRTERDPNREEVIAQVRGMLRGQFGNPHAGQAVFKKVCGQCHKIYGEGTDVGPDITSNGRASLEQLFSNVLDPSRVIGIGYQARSIATVDGRLLVGLPVEENDQRVVLKIQGGKLETIPRAEIDELVVSKLSMMPQDVEKQLKPEELVDLFAFLSLDKPPSDPQAKRLPSGGQPLLRTTNVVEFDRLVGEVAPGFECLGSGEQGVVLHEQWRGRQRVLQTHPVSDNTPSVLRSRVHLPAAEPSRLALEVGHHPQGDWRLVVKVADEIVQSVAVDRQTAKDGWLKVNVDLSRFAGKAVKIELENHSTDWAWEFAYWGRVTIEPASVEKGKVP